jgi:DNA-binding GntR family transcriptional regulator
VQPVQRTLLSETAYEAIRDAIVRGDLPPGSPVRDADLAEQLGLSRAPVRSALARLAADGLVETKPQSYTRVTAVAPREVRDAAAVVRAMHELAARIAVPLLTADHVTTMRAANRRFKQAADVDEAMRADDELHDVFVRVCGNLAVAATIERYTPLIRRLERIRFSPATAGHSARLHDKLIAASGRGDVEAAVAITAQIWHSLENLADLGS